MKSQNVGITCITGYNFVSRTLKDVPVARISKKGAKALILKINSETIDIEFSKPIFPVCISTQLSEAR